MRALSLLPLTVFALGAGMAAAQEGPEVVLAGAGERVEVPSGQEVTVQDVIRDAAGPDGMALRFRFIAPGIADGVDFDRAAADMQHLCDAYALPRLAEFGEAAQVVISLSASPVEFGQSAPDVVQFFESYRIEGGACQWEMF